MNTQTRPSCVIAEDEQIFREALNRLLVAQWPELNIVASCEDGAEALEALAEHQPSVAFLDIRITSRLTSGSFVLRALLL